MEITGKIIQALPEVGGTSQRTGNAWRKREYVLETQETYPKKVMFSLFGDRIDQYPVNVGEVVTVSFDLNSREFNGRWYTDVSAWKIDRTAAQAPGSNEGAFPPPPMPNVQMPGGYPTQPADLTAPAGGDDNLPF